MSSSISRVIQFGQGDRLARVSIAPGLKADAVARELRKDPNVLYAEPNWIYRMAATPDDPLFNLQYGLLRAKVDLAWDVWTADATTTLAPVVIGMVDSGVAIAHEDLFSKIYTDSSGRLLGKNLVNNNRNPWDDNGHGTLTAGIVAGRTNNGKGDGLTQIGIAGVAGWDGVAADSDRDSVKILPIKVIDQYGNATAQNIADGIQYAIDSGAKIIFLPVAGFEDSVTISTKITAANSAGCLVIAPAGNDGLDLVNYPAAYPTVMSVAATDIDGSNTLTSWSNYGTWVKVAAPGANIFSTTMDGYYGYGSGTSMAAALVAGEAALLLAQKPTLNPTQLSNLITKYRSSYTAYSGHLIATTGGLVNVQDAVKAGCVNQGAGIVSITIDGNPTHFDAGHAYTGHVNLANPVKAATTVAVTIASNNADVTIEGDGGLPVTSDTVTVAATTSTQPFTITVATAAATGTCTITGTQETRAADGAAVPPVTQVLLARDTGAIPVGPLVASVAVSPTSIAGGNTVTGAGVITLSHAADWPTIISLMSSDAAATVPAFVSINQGDTTATFDVTTTAVASDTAGVKITAQHGLATGVASNTFDVTAAKLLKIELSKASVYAGGATVATVYYDGKPWIDATETVTVSDYTVATVTGYTVGPPASDPAAPNVTVAAATGTGTVTVTSLMTAVEQSAIIKVGAGGGAKQKTLSVRPFSSLLSISPDTVKGGIGMAIGTLTVPEAVTADTTFTLSASPSGVFANFPASVTILNGKTSIAFNLDANSVSADTIVAITASNAGYPSSVGRITVTKPILTGVQVDPGAAVPGSVVALSVQLDAPAPTGNMDVALTTTDSTAFPLPAGSKITVLAGATSGSANVTVGAITAAETVTIGATVGSDTPKTTTLSVAPVIGDYNYSPTVVAAGTSVTGSISTNSIVSTSVDTTVTLTATAGSAALGALPTVKILKNANSATFTVPTVGVAADTNVTIQAAIGSAQASASFKVTAPQLTGVTLNPTTIVHNSTTNTSTGTLSLGAAVPAAGVTATISVSNPSVIDVVSPAAYNSTTKTWTFPLTSKAVASDTTVTVYAKMGSVTKSATITVKPLLASISVTPTSIVGAGTATGTITLNGTMSGTPPLTVTSTRPTVASVSALTAPASAPLTRTFTVTGGSVASTQIAVLRADGGLASRTTQISVTSATVASVAMSPATISYGAAAGTTSTGTVTLAQNAPTGGLTVNLAAQNPLIVTVPATVLVPGGSRTITFTATARPVTVSTTTSIKASITGSSASASLTVTPLLTGLTVGALTGGKTATGTITLAALPTNPTYVYLTCDKPDLVVVPGSVKFTTAKTATFNILVNGVGTSTTANIRATCNSVTLKATPAVAAGPNISLKLSPSSVKGGRNVTGIVQVNSPIVGSAFVITLTASGDGVDSVLNLPASVSIAVGQKSASFSFTTDTVTDVTSAIITGTNGSLTKTATLIINP